MKDIKLLFILLKHGINPFSKFGKNGYKLNRLTNKDREYINNNFEFNLWHLIKDKEN